MNARVAGIGTHEIVVVTRRREDHGAARTAGDGVAADARVERPADRQLHPIIVARGRRTNHRFDAILAITEVHARKINAVHAYVRRRGLSPRRIEPEFLAVQPGAGLVDMPAMKYRTAFEHRGVAEAHLVFLDRLWS